MVAAAVIGTVASAAISASAASDAADAQNHAIDAQSENAKTQQQLAQEQWDYQKNVYLPKAQQQADDQIAMSKQLTDSQIKNSDFYQGLASQSFDQAKKSYEFQDDYMQRARDYLSGNVGNTMANESNANVNQAFADTQAQTVRNAQRMGINPGSGAFASAMADTNNQKALALAGGQTAAQKAARDKAEQMVGIAAGAGQAGFGTGLSAGGLATGATASAGNINNTSLNGQNSVASTYGSGLASASSTLGQANAGWNSAVSNAQYTPWASAIGGLASSGLKTFGASGTNSTTNAFGVPIDTGNSTWAGLSNMSDQAYG